MDTPPRKETAPAVLDNVRAILADDELNDVERVEHISDTIPEEFVSVPPIHELMRRVRQHPDFVFGTIFTRADFEGDPDDEDAQPRSVEGFLAHYGHRAEDRLAEIGNELIEDVLNEPTGGEQ